MCGGESRDRERGSHDQYRETEEGKTLLLSKGEFSALHIHTHHTSTHITQGLTELAIHTIQIVERTNDSNLAQEDKLSSSDIRRGMMGSYRHTETKTLRYTGEGPYLIGLTGGIASGKSAILKRLAKKGACPIDCDKLGHEAYRVGSVAHAKIVEAFGEGVFAVCVCCAYSTLRCS